MLISLEVMVFGWFKSSSSVPCPCVVDFVVILLNLVILNVWLVILNLGILGGGGQWREFLLVTVFGNCFR
ncbi:hypothetical protein Hanom_Chr00s001626g01684561 [Helianthus anomalus]